VRVVCAFERLSVLRARAIMYSAMTYSHVCHDVFTRVPRLIRECAMTHVCIHVRVPDLCTVPLCLHMCAMTHSRMCHHDSLTHTLYLLMTLLQITSIHKSPICSQKSPICSPKSPVSTPTSPVSPLQSLISLRKNPNWHCIGNVCFSNDTLFPCRREILKNDVEKAKSTRTHKYTHTFVHTHLPHGMRCATTSTTRSRYQ